MLNIISILVICFSLFSAYRLFINDKKLIRNIYFTRIIDYPKALLMCFGMLLSVTLLTQLDMPRFLTWSWFSLFSENSEGGNLMFGGFDSSSYLIVLLFWFILSLALPYLARTEEEIFRSGFFSVKSRIVSNFKFGLIHMIMGVPLFVALLLSVVGYTFSFFYTREFKRQCFLGSDYNEANENAIFVATSIHTKYNFILITLVAIISILVILK